MKKYLFLLLLFIVYLVLLLQKDDSKMVSYENLNNTNAVKVLIKFENGINSSNLLTLFSDYDNDYYVYSLDIYNEEIGLSCNLIQDCINDVFNQKDELFYLNYITNGFKVDKMSFIAYKDEVINFLEKNDLAYEFN